MPPFGRSEESAPSRLTAIGGGSGLAVLLRGLRHEVRGAAWPDGAIGALTAVVTVADDGGSSGLLRRDFGVPPPGDIRNCIAALADEEDLLTRLFQYRFANGGGLSGHSFGNLLLTALTDLRGGFYQAILAAESILSVRGRVLPATLEDVSLKARGASGRVYAGESAIGTSGERLASLALEPAGAPAFPPAVEAIAGADLVLLGPGSLYTSIIPNLLIREIRAALVATRAPRVLLLNLMTQPGETAGMNAVDHLEAIEHIAGPGLLDAVLVSTTPLAPERLARYAEQGAAPVAVDAAALAAIAARGVEVIAADLTTETDLIRHDPARLTAKVLALAAERRRPVAAR